MRFSYNENVISLKPWDDESDGNAIDFLIAVINSQGTATCTWGQILALKTRDQVYISNTTGCRYGDVTQIVNKLWNMVYAPLFS